MFFVAISATRRQSLSCLRSHSIGAIQLAKDLLRRGVSRMFIQRIIWLTSAFCILSTKAVADNEKGSAVMKAKVFYQGIPPAAKPLPDMKADPVCKKAH